MKILFLPGLDGTGKLLVEVVGLLSSNHDVTVVRYPPDQCGYNELKRKVKAALPIDDYVIVAESFSGPLAAMIASERPKGLRGVVFVATFAKTPIKVPQALTYLVDIAPIKSRFLMRLAQPLLMGRWATPQFTESFRGVMQTLPASTVAGRLREILRVDVAKRLLEIKVPIVYLAASNDRLVPSRTASDFDLSPNTVVEVQGPHFLLQANADESAKHILSFVARFD